MKKKTKFLLLGLKPFPLKKKKHNVIRPRSLVPLASLLLQRIGDFGKTCDSSSQVKKCCAEKGVIILK